MHLVYFTASYPYGSGELWKTHELLVLKNHFQKVTVVPFHYANNKKPVDFIENISYIKPLFEDLNIPYSSKKIVKIIFSTRFFFYIKEFWRYKVYRRKKFFISWLNHSYWIEIILNHPMFRNIIKTYNNSETIYYFFWGRRASESIPLLRNNALKFVRFHGFDLYEDRNGGYIPYQYEQIKKLDFAILVSKDGLRYLSNKYPEYQNKFILSRLGTKKLGKSIPSNDDKLRIVSCSSVIPLKRVHLITKALSLIKEINIEWIHIGGGSEYENLSFLCIKYLENSKNVKYKLLGHINSEEVLKFYDKKQIDLFINVSSYEGIPVSIMEAMAASIPVIAPDIGGIREIVNKETGIILKSDFNVQKLADTIKEFYYLSESVKTKLRQNSFTRFNTNYNIGKNTLRLLQIMKNSD